MRPYVALMVDPYHDYLGQMGKVLTEQWKSGDVIQVQFTDGKVIEAGAAAEGQVPKMLVWPEEAPKLAQYLPPLATKYQAVLIRLHELNADDTVPERVKQAVREEFTHIFRDFYDYRDSQLMAIVKGHLKGTGTPAVTTNLSPS